MSSKEAAERLSRIEAKLDSVLRIVGEKDVEPDNEGAWNRVQVGAFCGLAAATIEALDAKGQGPRSFRVGRAVRYRPADVREWLKARQNKGGGEK